MLHLQVTISAHYHYSDSVNKYNCLNLITVSIVSYIKACVRDYCKSSSACLEIKCTEYLAWSVFVLSSWSFLKANLVSFLRGDFGSSSYTC